MPFACDIDLESNVNIEAEGLFTDREEPRKSFWDVYGTIANGSYEVVAYYGTGGIGKTTLLKKLAKEMEEKVKGGKKDYLFISFEGKPDKEYVLYMISRQLMLTNKGLTCPLFDTAFIRLLESSGKSVEKYENEMKKSLFDNPLVQAVIDIADDVSPIPGLSVAAGMIEKAAAFAGQKITERERTTGANAHIYSEIAYSDGKELRNKLHEYLRKDLYVVLSKREKPFVLFLDGYENFVDIRVTGTEGMRLEADQWLKDPERGLVVLPNSLWVLSGREQPHWDKEILPPEHMHRIGDLSEKDAVDFFRRAGVKEDVLVHELFDITNGTPAYMDMSVSTYRKILKDRTPVISDFGKDTSELARRYLENMNKDMKKMIYILAALPNVWSRELAEETAEKTGNGYCIHMLDEILCMSIVERVDDGFRLHKTLRDVIKKEDEFSINLTEPVDDVTAENDSELVKAAMEQVAIQLATKVIESADDSYRMGNIREFADAFSSLESPAVSEDALEKLIEIIRYELKVSGKYFEGESIYFSLCERVEALEYAPRLVVLCKNARSYNLYKLGKYAELSELAEKTYDYAKAKLDKDSPEMLGSIASLALSYHVKGDYKKAVSLDKQCYEERVRILGEEHPDTLASLNNLASGYAMLGDKKMGTELEKKCYEIRVRVLGEEHPDTLLSMSNMAINYSRQKEYEKALEIQKKCYEIRAWVLGKEHPDALKSLHSVATCYSLLGDDKKALEIRTQVYETRVKVLGGEHPETLNSLNDITKSYTYLDDYDKALEFGKKCYEARKKVLGEEHPHTLTSMVLLSNIYDNLKDDENAFELREECYKLRVRVLGKEHRDTLETLHKYGISCYKVSDKKKALELLEECYHLKERTLGEDNGSTLNTLRILAILCFDEKQIEKARRLMQKCYDGLMKTVGEEDWTTIKCLKYLGEMYSTKKGTPESTRLFEKSYELASRIVKGKEEIETLDILYCLANSRNDSGEKKKALQNYLECYMGMKQLFGEDNPRTQKVRIRIQQLRKIINDFKPEDYM